MEENKNLATNKAIMEQVELRGREPFTIEIAIGSRGRQLKEMSKKVENFQKMKKEDEALDEVCKIIAEFSSFDSGEQVFNTLTQLEIMDVYFSIQGDQESVGRLFRMSQK